MSKLDHVSFSRRQLLAGAAATAGFAASAVAPAAAKAPLTNTQAPSFYRFKIGSIEATVVSDGPLPIGPASRTFRGPSEAELGKMFGDHHADRQRRARPELLVINTGDRLVLFDTGMSLGEAPNTQTGRLLTSMQQAGIDPRTSTPSCSPIRTSTIPAGWWPTTAAACSRTRKSTCSRSTSISGWTTSGSARRRKAPPGPRGKPAALPRPHHLHQGRPGDPAGRAGGAHARAHRRSHRLHDLVGRQDHLQYRRRRPSPDPVRSPAGRGRPTPIPAGRGIAGQAVRHARRAAHPADGLAARARPARQQGDGFRFVPTPMQLAL